jgi:hypothetical protein
MSLAGAERDDLFRAGMAGQNRQLVVVQRVAGDQPAEPGPRREAARAQKEPVEDALLACLRHSVLDLDGEVVEAQ